MAGHTRPPGEDGRQAGEDRHQGKVLARAFSGDFYWEDMPGQREQMRHGCFEDFVGSELSQGLTAWYLVHEGRVIWWVAEAREGRCGSG